MGKVKKKRKLRITLRGITLTIVIAAYILLIVGSFYWSDNHYFKAISPFADFPLTEDGKRDGFDLFLRIIGLCFVIISIRYSAQLFMTMSQRKKYSLPHFFTDSISIVHS